MDVRPHDDVSTAARALHVKVGASNIRAHSCVLSEVGDEAFVAVVVVWVAAAVFGASVVPEEVSVRPVVILELLHTDNAAALRNEVRHGPLIRRSLQRVIPHMEHL